MNDEYIEKMLQAFKEFQERRSNLEQTIELIKNSKELADTSKSQMIPFLEGYGEGLKVAVEWLNRIIP